MLSTKLALIALAVAAGLVSSDTASDTASITPDSVIPEADNAPLSSKVKVGPMIKQTSDTASIAPDSVILEADNAPPPSEVAASPAKPGATKGELGAATKAADGCLVASPKAHEIIEKNFKGLDDGSALSELQSVRHDRERPFELCRTRSVHEVLKILDIWPICNPHSGTHKTDQTCRAVYAAVKTFDELAAIMPNGPAFKNYLPVSWQATTKSLVPTCSEGTLGQMVVPSDGSPPTAKFMEKKGNGCNAYGLCSILITTLMQANDQSSTGTCGPQALYAAISFARPARAIKMATHLMWTGTYAKMEVCDGIRDLQPGLIPWESGMPGCGCSAPQCHETRGKTGAKCGAHVCTGNADDCKRSATRPYQQSGLSYMISQAFLSSVFHKITGSCDEPQIKELKAIYGAMSPPEAKAVNHAQATQAQHLMDLCDHMIGSGVTCHYLKNTDKCPKVQGGCAEAKKISLLGGMTPTDQRILEDLVAQKSTKTNPRVAEFLEKLMKACDSQEQCLMEMVEYIHKPSFTAELLEEACNSLPAVLFVQAGPINHGELEPGADCNHWVTLQACDQANNKYSVWSWGKQYELKKDMILGTQAGDKNGYTNGAVCSMITVKKI